VKSINFHSIQKVTKISPKLLTKILIQHSMSHAVAANQCQVAPIVDLQ